MKKHTKLITAPALLCALGAIQVLSFANAAPITAVDFDSITEGAKIVGPVGPDVEVSIINGDGNSIGDLRSSVSCPEGFATCVPPNNPSGTIYTYSHTFIPGVDLPNDAPFPNPPTVVDFDNVSAFSLGFAASGFNGVAGYRFSQALDASVIFSIELSTTGELSWLTNNDEWDTGEAITFFWQTTQAPSGPGGTFLVSNETGDGSGRGPIPTPVPVAVNAPSSLALLIAGLLFAGRRFTAKA